MANSTSDRYRLRLTGRIERMTVGQLLAMTIGVLLVLASLGIGLALIANKRLTNSRNLLLNQVRPAQLAALSLENALVNEETGVRGYLITSEPRFLEPYRSGLESERVAYRELRMSEKALGPMITGEIEMIRLRTRAWRQGYVTPVLAHAHGSPRGSLSSDVQGKRLFDAVRPAITRLQSTLARRDAETHRKLTHAAAQLTLLLVLALVLLVGGILGAGYILRWAITRPLARLGSEARRVAGGEFRRPLTVVKGPREIAQVGSEIDVMREQITFELATVEAARVQLEEQAAELQRSNAELEQFAYVASHDLQEPLRKVTSFCQALSTRYRGQLDDRADEYIDFAVDGAKRMQTLINDLLAFSRVGREELAPELIALNDALAAAQADLADALRRAGARVEAGELPTVRGDLTLLTSLFENLIGNAVKFRGAEPPVIRIGAHREGEEWQLSCADNGIGIEPEYGERIFLIFQRLHSRESYEGSGIGLALCRKIVEYHGGHMWLDNTYSGGARLRWTLPIPNEGPI